MKTAAIAKGNSKLGKGVFNISLAPCAGCSPNAPCKKECYAMKAFRQYKETRVAWTRNLDMARSERENLFSDITEYLIRHKVQWFRWHVSGDIQDQDYLDRMKAIAEYFTDIKFLVFTKMHDLDYSNLPANLTVVFSMWPQWGNTTKNMRRAWMDDGTEDRIPESAIECPGSCENCMICWNLPKINRDVFFHKH